MQSEIFGFIGQRGDQVLDQACRPSFNLAMLLDGVSPFAGCI